MEKIFEDGNDLSTNLINHIVSIYMNHVKNDGSSFNIALSGGSVISTLTNPLFTTNQNVRYIDWNIYFVDERCVEINDPESNIGTAMRAWKGTGISEANWIDIKGLDESSLPDRMDVVILGMGPDGHTASLFPSKKSFLESLTSKCKMISVDDSPKPPANRISMTIDYLNRSNNIIFVIKGKEKSAALQRVRKGDQDLPASHIHNATWFMTVDVVNTIG